MGVQTDTIFRHDFLDSNFGGATTSQQMVQQRDARLRLWWNTAARLMCIRPELHSVCSIRVGSDAHTQDGESEIRTMIKERKVDHPNQLQQQYTLLGSGGCAPPCKNTIL